MKINYDKLHEFLKVDDYGYYDSRSISLDEIYDGYTDELTINEMVDLLDYIYNYTNEQIDYSETAVYNINIHYAPHGGETAYLLEMRWPTIFDNR